MKISDITENNQPESDYDLNQLQSYSLKLGLDSAVLKHDADKIYQRNGGDGNPQNSRAEALAAAYHARLKEPAQKQQRVQPDQHQPSWTKSKPQPKQRSKQASAGADTAQTARRATTAMGKAWQRGTKMADKYVGVHRKSR